MLSVKTPKLRLYALLLTGMYSSILPPAKTPKSFGPSFLSESMVKITFSITIPVIKIKSRSQD